MNSLLQPRIFYGLSEVQVTIWICVALVLCFPLAAQTSGAKEPSTSATSVRAQLIGSWRLVSRQSRRTGGEAESDPGLSLVPLGVLIYDQSGHVAAQLS